MILTKGAINPEVSTYGSLAALKGVCPACYFMATEEELVFDGEEDGVPPYVIEGFEARVRFYPRGY